MDWILISVVVGVLAVISLIVYTKLNSGITFIEGPSFRNIPGCGRRFIKKVLEKMGGC